jgi:1-acyl-sn-glycerol-3-phosphate acyltransferase
MSWNWMFRNVVVGPPVRVLFPIDVIGRENLPAKGPYILAIGPHLTEIESVLIAINLAEQEIHFFAKAEYWDKNRLTAWFMDHTGQIPIRRTDSRSADESLTIGATILKRGGILALYPEGTRSKDGKLHKGRVGVARTAIRAGGVHIVPVGLIGMEKLNPSGKGLRPGAATIVIGKPIDPLHYQEIASHAGRATKYIEHALSRPVTDVLMKEIARLSGAQYSNDYSTIPGQ